MKNLAYVTLVDRGYSGYFSQLVRSHKEFSKFPLICAGVNYDPVVSDNCISLNIHHEEVSKYDHGIDSEIKNDKDRIRAIICMKPKILEICSGMGFSGYLFIDSDCILTPNSDHFFESIYSKESQTEFPISTYYKNTWSTSHNWRSPGLFDPEDRKEHYFSYYPLHKKYGTQFYEIWYKTTFCIFFTKNCRWFLKEASGVISDPSLKENFDYYLNQEDETTFNYLYSKYNFHTGISPIITFDVGYNVDPSDFESRFKDLSLSRISSVFHLKYHKSSEDPYLINPENRNLADVSAYDSVFRIISTRASVNRRRRVKKEYLEISEDESKFHFHNIDLEGNHEVFLCSPDDPTVFGRYLIDFQPGYNYYIGIPKLSADIRYYASFHDMERIPLDLLML